MQNNYFLTSLSHSVSIRCNRTLNGSMASIAMEWGYL